MTALATTTPNAIVTMGFGSLESFEFMQRTARMFSNSSMVPTAYRAVIEKGYGANVTYTENPSALPNCVIALNMSQRMNADPLMIMQNLHVIEGRPSWSSQFIIAAINSCGRYSPLRFELKQGEEIDATCTTFEWENNKKKAVVTKTRVKNKSCVAWAIELATNTRLESPMVTMEMAVNEGWYGKNGSKWQTMDELMLRYRTAAFFGRIYAPELLMGLPSAEETRDVITVTEQPDGSYAEDPAPVVKQPQSKSAMASNKQPAEDAAIKTPASADMPADPPAATATAHQPAAAAANQTTGELPGTVVITANQAKYLATKINAIELPETAVAAMLARVGAPSLEALTIEQFDTVKAELLGMGACTWPLSCSSMRPATPT